MDQQGLPRFKKPFIADDEIMELLWQNGQVVTQSQNQRHINNSPPGRNSDESTRGRTSLPRENQYLFVQEGEMAPVLHYPNNNDDVSPLNQPFSADFLNNDTMQTPQMRSEQVPPNFLNNGTMQAPQMRSEVPPNFASFARHGVRAEPEALPAGESIVDSCDTPEVAEGETSLTAPSATFEETDGWSSDLTDYWSSHVEMEEDPKRKRRDAEEWEYQSQVNSLSERRRRDLINEKMRVLQQLIPRSNKFDEESILDEAIEYMKSLQLQVQMMSMECSMVPMMFPGTQRYMPPPIGMGINRPVMPFPNMFSDAVSVNAESGNEPNKCQQVRRRPPVRR
ncbi:unnamed protein product [Vicia faba]|uniref:BHLH domain-containing protein n=1 Tax=Vicia faba TaxID=3906 RepID=A0AAV1AW71_VICFA|nr:unnamed protein product [Vicia faba]